MLGMSFESAKNPNPQGKGLVPVLHDWETSRPRYVQSKDLSQWLLDWFASVVVLSSSFSFKPRVDQSYFLYWYKKAWRLSLVAPHEWGTRAVGECLGCCVLNADMTWSIQPAEGLADRPVLLAQVQAMVEGFLNELDEDGNLDDRLPGYRRELPYYQRMLATALGTSLRESVDNRDLLAAPSSQLLAANPADLIRRLTAPPSSPESV